METKAHLRKTGGIRSFLDLAHDLPFTWAILYVIALFGVLFVFLMS